jgi:S-adenosylmethionine decarboxylase proenzyme
MQGLHILAEWHDCATDTALLTNVEQLAACCRAACCEARLTPVAEAFHQFPGSGATGAIVLAESHLAVHTWPELKAVTLDLYVCNFSQNNQAAAETAYTALLAVFRPRHVERRDITRGEVDLHHANNPRMR